MVIDPANIIDWYRDNARDLPWRRPGTTPWGVLLSEVMSHQTPVARVAPIWEEWIARWPTPADLAAAPTDDVLRAWGTLGYPRRALRLKECAQSLVDDHHGRVPSSVDSLLALPGIGDYTARAVAAFAYGQAVPVVDTNVRRVYARAVAGRPLARPQKAELEWVAALLPTAADSADAAGHAHPADSSAAVFSAGLMELGATVCTAANPACGTCPLLDSCAWVAAGSPAPTEEELARRKVQKFAGTDRQVRGKIMKVLREASGPVPQAAIDIVWPDDGQRSRALYSLLDDGLAVQDSDGQFRLP
ncbi:A/G-specific adenine glycosylase [Corynebacterium sp. p3-SID1145]|nr:A/G-specific adenine glycosylase [Corynebacterium sp. p3-SID1145]MCT1462154.1 A/G-specific adenine glycosylase [Corynebacterium sp. p3-SID1140]